jgi:plastocyanin
MRKVLIGLLGVALVAGGCMQQGVKGPQRYTVNSDLPSPAGKKFQVSAYFPGTIKVRPGDTIVFRNRSTEAPHTISFGIKPDLSNQPSIITSKGENPAVHEPCYAPAASTSLAKCASKTLPAFTGKGYWNSGYLEPVPAPKSMGPKTTRLRIAGSIAVGTYRYVCILHPLMAGVVRVMANDDDRVSQADVRAEGVAAATDAVAAAEKIPTPQLQQAATSAVLAAGWGNRVTAVNRFGPEKVSVKAGTTVKWVARSPYEPHTVTFGNEIKTPGDPRTFTPIGPKSGGAYTGGLANSGIIAPPGRPFPTEYSLRFTKAGSYTYTCILHPGMAGTVTVT